MLIIETPIFTRRVILMLFLFEKSERSNLTDAQAKALLDLARQEFGNSQ